MVLRFTKVRVRRLWKIILLVAVPLLLSPLVYFHFKEVYLGRDGVPYYKEQEISMVTKQNQHQAAKLHSNIRVKTDRHKDKHNGTLEIVTVKKKHDNTTINGTLSQNAAIDRMFSFIHSPYKLLAGMTRKSKGNLTIGIPSVHRHNTKVLYLVHTLKSIIRSTTEAERSVVTVVILLSDNNDTYKADTVREITNTFRPQVESGFINIIELIPEVYPDLSRVRATFNDSRQRLIWRAKQNIDFAYLMMYGRNISKYYLQLEDDVIAADNFLQDIYDFITKQSNKWFVLEFSYLGFIGKLFKSMDLSWISRFLLHHFDVAPCDLLLGVMRGRRHQLDPIHINVTLFQHIGKFSSLKHKLMPSVDVLFKDKGNVSVEIDEIPSGVYPRVRIDTSLETYMDYIPHNVYDGDLNSFFWGKTVKKGDNFTLKFYTPQNFSRIVILSGNPALHTDRISKADLLAANTLKSNGHLDKESKCENLSTIANFVDGQIDTFVTGSKIPKNISCLVISYTKKSRWWSIIREMILVR